MLTVKIKELKIFMEKLLVNKSFDDFLLIEATLQMGVSYVIDGKHNLGFYSAEEKEQNICPYDYIQWKHIKSTLFSLIKGKKTPLAFKIIMHLDPGLIHKLFSVDPEQVGIKSFILNIKFDGSRAFLTTCVNYASFTPDKSYETIWDNYLKAFLTEQQILFD